MDSTLSVDNCKSTLDSDNLTLSFKVLPERNFLQKISYGVLESVAKCRLKSLKNAWQIAKENDLSKTFASNWRPGSFISTCFTPKGTVYLTANPQVMKFIFQHYRKDNQDVFLDHENTKLFIKAVLTDIYPDELKCLSLDEAADMIPITASFPYVKALREPILRFIGAARVKELQPKIDAIANEIIDQLTESEKDDCNAETLGLEFAVTVISKIITGYEATRAQYRQLSQRLNEISQHMTRVVSFRPATKTEQIAYQTAIKIVRTIIDDNLQSPSPFVKMLLELGWSTLKIRANLFLLYFAGIETTASSINYLLWQLGKDEHQPFLNELCSTTDEKLFLSKLITETLRLHPPSFVIGRQLRTDILVEVHGQNKLLKKMKLFKGHSLLCLLQVAALDPLLYPNPTVFNPHRFQNIPLQLPWAPFGVSTHVCPGQYLATAEIGSLVLQLAKRFHLKTLFPAEQTQQKGFFTLRATPARLKLTALAHVACSSRHQIEEECSEVHGDRP